MHISNRVPRSIFSVLAGCGGGLLFVAILVILVQAAIALTIGEDALWEIAQSSLCLDMANGLIFLVAGFVTAILAENARLVHAAITGFLLATLNLVFFFMLFPGESLTCRDILDLLLFNVIAISGGVVESLWQRYQRFIEARRSWSYQTAQGIEVQVLSARQDWLMAILLV